MNEQADPSEEQSDDRIDNGPTAAGSIIPSSSVAGNALTLIIAIMSFLACLAIGGVTLISNAADSWRTDVSREITVQILPDDTINMDEALAKVVAATDGVTGIAKAEIVGEAESAKLLEPWLGRDADLSELPVPRLVRITLSDAAADLGGFRERLSKDVPKATVDDHKKWIAHLTAVADTAVYLGLTVLVLVFAATVLSVVFATWAAMESNRDVVEVLHYVGAEDSYIAGQYERHFLALGLKGGIAGGAIAVVLFLGLAFLFNLSGDINADQIAALVGQASIGLTGYLGAVCVVIAIAVMTALTSRFAVRRYLSNKR